MPMRAGNDANMLLAFYQGLSRVCDRLSPETCKAVLEALDKRPDSLEKFHLFQAIGLLTQRVYEVVREEYGQAIACVVGRWAIRAELSADDVWERLYGYCGPEIWGAPRKPSVDDHPVLVDLVDDVEVMGLLGLEAGWTPDLKQLDPTLDITPTDQGLNF